MNLDPDPKRTLGLALHDLRAARGLSTRALAAALDQSQSRISRIDRGEIAATAEDVDAWCDRLQATPEQRRELREKADELTVHMRQWRREVATGRHKLQRDIAHLQETATEIRLFAHDLPTGEWQTEAAARAIFQLQQPHDDGPADDVDAAVQARIEGQQLLDDTSKRFRLLSTEAALCDDLVTGQDHADLIERVLAVADRPNCDVGIIPFHARRWLGRPRRHSIYHAFAVIGNPHVDAGSIVLYESVTDGVHIRDEERVATYVKHFDQLMEDAVTGDQLPLFLRELAEREPSS